LSSCVVVVVVIITRRLYALHRARVRVIAVDERLDGVGGE
jgi:hypothetical protein